MVDPRIKKYLRSEFIIENGLNPECLDGIVRFTIEFGVRYLKKFDEMAKVCIIEQIEKFRRRVNEDCDQKISRLNSVYSYELTRNARLENLKKLEAKKEI